MSRSEAIPVWLSDGDPIDLRTAPREKLIEVIIFLVEQQQGLFLQHQSDLAELGGLDEPS